MSTLYKVDLEAIVFPKDDQWVATTRQLGFTVFSDSENGALDRLEEALQSLIKNYVKGSPDPTAKAREFLDFHGVSHDIPSDMTPDRVRRVRTKIELALNADL